MKASELKDKNVEELNENQSVNGILLIGKS